MFLPSTVAQEVQDAGNKGEPSEQKIPAGSEQKSPEVRPAEIPPKPGADPNLPADPGVPVDPLPIPELPAPVPVPFRAGPLPTYPEQPLPVDILPTAGEVESVEAQEAPGQTYLVSNFYGGAPQQFTAGQGALAGDGFAWGGFLTAGYDDNYTLGGGGALGQEKKASAFTGVGLNASIRSAKRMQLLMLDANVGSEYYWDADELDFNFDIGLVFQRRFVAPAQLTANVRVAYLSQPDYSQINLVTTESAEDDGAGNSFIANAKIDYGYRWTPQFSTVTSVAANLRAYEGRREEDDLMTWTAGNEFRFRADRFTWIAETRFEMLQYPNAEDRDSNSVYLLLGAEWKLGEWILASCRVGETVRSFDAGGNASSPYGEFAINFRPDIQNAFSLSTRYGFEAGNTANDENKAFRVGLSYTRAITSRLSASVGGNYISNDQSGLDGAGGSTILNGSVSLNFRASSRVTYSASYTGTISESEGGLQDYEQNRFTLTGNIQF